MERQIVTKDGRGGEVRERSGSGAHKRACNNSPIHTSITLKLHAHRDTHTHQVVAVLLDSFNNAWCARARVRVRALNT